MSEFNGLVLHIGRFRVGFDNDPPTAVVMTKKAGVFTVVDELRGESAELFYLMARSMAPVSVQFRGLGAGQDPSAEVTLVTL